MGGCLSAVRRMCASYVCGGGRFDETDENCYRFLSTNRESVYSTNDLSETHIYAPSFEGSSSVGKISCEKTVRDLASKLKKKTAEITKLTRSHHEKVEQSRILKLALDKTLAEKETLIARSKELPRLLVEKEKALQDANLYASHIQAKCQRLEAQITVIVQKVAEESLASGSYSDDQANPGMLEAACNAVDNATEELARVLHDVSTWKHLPPNSAELQQFVGQISPADLAQFSRPIQVRYAWRHWICSRMFQGFENVFFDVDEGRRTSPLDPRKHALECFQSFQLKQCANSSDSDALFQAFCSRKYKSVFPQLLVNQAFSPNEVVCNEKGRFNGDGEIYDCFTEVARAVWLLHELAFAFDPPASILRMANGTPFDRQFHESVIPVEDDQEISEMVVMMMTRPGFRVRKSIVRSQVFLCSNPASVSLLHVEGHN